MEVKRRHVQTPDAVGDLVDLKGMSLMLKNKGGNGKKGHLTQTLVFLLFLIPK